MPPTYLPLRYDMDRQWLTQIAKIDIWKIQYLHQSEGIIAMLIFQKLANSLCFQGFNLQKQTFANVLQKNSKKIYTNMQYSQENILNKVAGLRLETLLTRDSNTDVSLLRFVKFLRTPILKNICERLLLRPNSSRLIFEM